MICLEEATVDDKPNSLKQLLSSLPPDNLNEKELFTIILFIVSIESGFTWNNFVEDVPLRHRVYSFDIRRLRSIPNESVYVAWSTKLDHFKKDLYLGGVEAFKCTLVATPWRNTMTVHISHSLSLLCFSSIFVLPDFIHQSEPKYDKIKELIIKLRNDLFHPMKSYILTEASIANPSLLGLPLEIIVKIVEYLSVRDFLNLCACCRHFHINLTNSDTIWVYFCKQFCVSDKPDSLDWRTHFKNAFNR